LEGTGSFAAGLVTVLAEAGEDVVEIQNNKRSRGAKNDRIDAVQAARTALAQTEQATPRDRGLREALRQVLVTRQSILMSRTKAINELKSFIVDAPEHLRAQLRGLGLAKQLDRIDVSSPPGATIEHRVTVRTLRSIAARIRFLINQAAELDVELLVLIPQHPAGPALLAESGVGPVVAAQLLVSWSHRGRVRNEAAFASLAGVAPLEASSGQRTRHRLSRMGDRNLNRALHTVAITRLRCHEDSRNYETRRSAQGKTHRDVRRSLKRILARRFYRLIQAATVPANTAEALAKAA
jgi:transposase